MHLLRCGISLLIFGLAVAIQSPSNDVSPAIAMVCEKNVQHRNLVTGEWISDPTGNKDCMDDKEEMLAYCSQVYPDRHIVSVRKEVNPVRISSWCSLGHPGPNCKGHSHKVTPILCIEGSADIPSLSVRPGCSLQTLHNPSLCKGNNYWITKARSKCMKLSMLLTDERSPISMCDSSSRWRGMEFVCCPDSTDKTPKTESPTLDPVCKQPKLVGFCRAAFEAWHFNADTMTCERFIYGGCGGNDNRFDSMAECLARCAAHPGKPSDPLTNILPVLKGVGPVLLKPEPTTTSTETTTTTESTTSSSYFDSSLDPGFEHQLYIKEKMKELKEHSSKVLQATHEWDMAKEQLLRSGASKAKMTSVDADYNSTMDALNKEHAQKQEQLLASHRARVDAIQVGARTAKLKKLKDALNSATPPKPSNVVRLFKHYLKTEQHEQKHITQHYDLAVQHGNADDVLSDLQTRLDNVQARVNFALQLLHQQPETEKQIQDELNGLIADMVPPITLGSNDDSDVTENDVSIDLQASLVVDHPITIDNGGLPAENMDDMEPIDDVIDDGNDVNDDDLLDDDDQDYDPDDDDEAVSDDEPEPLKPLPSDVTMDDSIDETDRFNEEDDDDDDDDQLDPNIAMIYDPYDDSKKTYSELLWLRWLGVVAIAVAVIVVILVSVRYYQRRGDRRHKFVRIQVDDQLTAEERQLLQMQQNGYENPTYKFFEKQQIA